MDLLALPSGHSVLLSGTGGRSTGAICNPKRACLCLCRSPSRRRRTDCCPRWRAAPSRHRLQSLLDRAAPGLQCQGLVASQEHHRGATTWDAPQSWTMVGRSITHQLLQNSLPSTQQPHLLMSGCGAFGTTDTTPTLGVPRLHTTDALPVKQAGVTSPRQDPPPPRLLLLQAGAARNTHIAQHPVQQQKCPLPSPGDGGQLPATLSTAPNAATVRELVGLSPSGCC